MEVLGGEGMGLRWMRVANHIREMVTTGVYEPGDRLPRQHDLARECGVSLATLKRALDLLTQEGYVVSRIGQGTFAADPEDRAPTALVVDDDANMLELFERMLPRAGWKCVAVNSGELALQKLAEQQFDLMFLDLVMPGMDGVQTFRAIRQSLPQANVVIVTAYPNTDLMTEALEVGPFGVMKKPFSEAELRVVLNSVALSDGSVSGFRNGMDARDLGHHRLGVGGGHRR